MVALISCAGGLLWAGGGPASATGAMAGRSAAAGTDRAAAYARSPLAFEPNRGQAAAGVAYLAHGPGYGVFITPRRTVLALTRRSGTGARGRMASMPRTGRRTQAMVSFRPVGGAADPVVAAGGRLAGRVNYLRGRDRAAWRTDVPTYREVTERGVYRGVDLRWYGTQRGLEYDVTAAPGADLRAVRFAIDGLRGRPHLTPNGDLVMPTAAGDVVQRAPRAFQVVGGARRPVAVRFALQGGDQVGFSVAGQDRRRPLVIDPGIVYSSYLGGSGYDEGTAIAVDASGDAYVGGNTESADFPVDAALQPQLKGGFDAFVTKLNATGTAAVYSTYLGGTGDDEAAAITVDAAGDAFLTGLTDSTDFPTTSGALQTAYGGGPDDAFVSKLDRTGSGLDFSTYLGGTDYDEADGIVIDAAGDAYLTGYTTSHDFPHTTAATLTGLLSAFATKLDAAGSAIVYSTYLGGTGSDYGYGIAVDSGGSAYIVGVTTSTDFPTTPGAFRREPGEVPDVFVTKLDGAGALVYSTYLGGRGGDFSYQIVVGPAGNAYVSGATDSPDFPVTAGAVQTRYGGGLDDAFVTELNPAGAGLVYSTYLGGGGDDEGYSIAVDAIGNAYLTGLTDSRNFPVTAGAFQTGYGGGSYDAFVAELNLSGRALVYSSYLGGSGYDVAYWITVDAPGDAYLTGATDSMDFPVSTGAFQTRYGGGLGDGFATRLNLVPAARPLPPQRPQRPRPSQRQRQAGNAVARNRSDAAVTGTVDTHLHTSSVNSSRRHDRAGHRRFGWSRRQYG